MQTSREVVDNLLRGKPADRVGLIGGPWADTILAWVAQGYPTHMVAKTVGKSRGSGDGAKSSLVTRGSSPDSIRGNSHCARTFLDFSSICISTCLVGHHASSSIPAPLLGNTTSIRPAPAAVLMAAR